MKKAGLLAASTIPSVVFGYALLVSILMKRIKPVPIMAMPDDGKRMAVPSAPLPKRQPAAV